jgi:hypothetical protein
MKPECIFFSKRKQGHEKRLLFLSPHQHSPGRAAVRYAAQRRARAALAYELLFTGANGIEPAFYTASTAQKTATHCLTLMHFGCTANAPKNMNPYSLPEVPVVSY